MLNHTSVRSGHQYSAQKIESKDLWVELGGVRSDIYKIDSFLLNGPKSKDESPDAYISTHLSYSFLEITPKDSIPEDNISITLDPSLTDQEQISILQSKKKSIEFGFQCKISSTRFSSFQEGWLYRHVISILNQIEGVEFQSYNYLPTLRLHSQLSMDSLSSKLTHLFQHLIISMKSKFSEIDHIDIVLKVGSFSVQKTRQEAESVIVEKRKSATQKVIPYSPSTDKGSHFLAFTFDQSIAPYAAIILTPWTCDPAGYLFYSDFSPTHFPKDLLTKYGIIFHPLGELLNSVTGEFRGINSYFAQLSFQSILRVELFGLEYPLPGSINSDVIIFPIPEHHGLGVLNSSYINKIFQKLSYPKLKEQYAEGHQYPQFQVLSQVELQTRLSQSPDLLLSKIVWMNSTLLDVLKAELEQVDLSPILTEIQTKSINELPGLKPLVELDSNYTGSEKNNVENIDTLDIQMIQDLLLQKKTPLHFKNATITLTSSDGSTYDVEFTNLQLKADSVRISKK
ncbi:Acetyl-CoA decarbonylase/synthase complex subunit beta [Candidatus Lokiarchaeum ossiferum]|uniref:Acetyl-CoA decarbonylase/synthase complex subunit beta n=1 Tax=Candidatus Lokiarchaeum ossiferum TaxID=2951803 RepID=A0ABY6HQ08_9ARCH|nr:Acetyl-CoA decarbonylase/synthase complex subunit beta [Candidatus Lokiarchaeum sp. B-35]